MAPQCTTAALPTLLSPTRRTGGKEVEKSFYLASPASLSGGPSPSLATEKTEDEVALRAVLREHTIALKSSLVPTRYRAAEALTEMGRKAKAARPSLEVALLKDKNVHVRKSAARALGEIGDLRAVSALERAFSDDEDKFVRERAQQALEALTGFVQL